MTKVICDLCGADIPEAPPTEAGEQVRTTEGCAIIKIEGEGWRFLDLCGNCQEIFRQFLTRKIHL